MEQTEGQPRVPEYFPPLQCGLRRVQVDFERHEIVLWLPPHECTDMSGAIAYAQSLDPDARVIRTVAGDVPDTIYVWPPFYRDWRAFTPSPEVEAWLQNELPRDMERLRTELSS